jgi:o-succinylbenzoate synthase
VDVTQFEFRRYQRSLYPPLRTSHGTWAIREGIILKFGKGRFGEIAPVDWFGSERLEDAIAFCQNPDFPIPDSLPACQFGFEPVTQKTVEVPLSGLLPAGPQSLSRWQLLWQEGYRTFKWKIGVSAIAEEFAILDQLTKELPESAQLRLDANAGLTLSDAKRWLEKCDSLDCIEFLEQPLAVNQFETMLQLSQDYQTTIALDESVATLKQLQDCYVRGWRGVFAIKAAIAGSPSRLTEFCQQNQIDAVFSSVFETEIGRCSGLQLAAKLSKRAAGYGTNHWFRDLNIEDFELIWDCLSKS